MSHKQLNTDAIVESFFIVFCKEIVGHEVYIKSSTIQLKCSAAVINLIKFED